MVLLECSYRFAKGRALNLTQLIVSPYSISDEFGHDWHFYFYPFYPFSDIPCMEMKGAHAEH